MNNISAMTSFSIDEFKTSSPILSELISIAKTSPRKKILHYWNAKSEKFQSLSWQEYIYRIQILCLGFQKIGINSNSKVLIVAPTGLEWDLSEKACYGLFANIVALDSGTPLTSVKEALEITNPDFIISTHDFINSLIKIRYPKENKITFINISINKSSEDFKDANKSSPFFDWHNLANCDDTKEQLNNCNKQNMLQQTGDEAATIVFTSGTSGKIKAVSYSQNQILNACKEIIRHEGGLGPKKRLLAWLPMAPLFQRVVNLCGLLMQTEIYFFYPPQEVMKALKIVRPDFFIAVPRFYEKLQQELEVIPPYLKKIFVKLYLRRLFPRDVILLSGSAALKKETRDFFESCESKIFEAYGLTECILPIALSTPKASKAGSVGHPLAANKIIFDDENQILVKGPYVASGYLNHDIESQQRWTQDNFFKTGDIGEVTEEGYLFLKGRKSYLLKLSNGKKVMRAKIEQTFQFKDAVDSFCVFGNEKPYLVGLLSLSKIPDNKETWTIKLEQYLQNFNKALPNYEQVHKLVILTRPLLVQSQELTVNLKTRYDFIENEFKEQFDSLYKNKNIHITWTT